MAYDQLLLKEPVNYHKNEGIFMRNLHVSRHMDGVLKTQAPSELTKVVCLCTWIAMNARRLSVLEYYYDQTRGSPTARHLPLPPP